MQLLQRALMTFSGSVDEPALMNQLIDSLPALPACELLDPADDQTLPRLVEVLQKRHRIRLLMTEQFNKTGGLGRYTVNGDGKTSSLNDG